MQKYNDKLIKNHLKNADYRLNNNLETRNPKEFKIFVEGKIPVLTRYTM
jgi:hypothetical protein